MAPVAQKFFNMARRARHFSLNNPFPLFCASIRSFDTVLSIICEYSYDLLIGLMMMSGDKHLVYGVKHNCGSETMPANNEMIAGIIVCTYVASTTQISPLASSPAAAAGLSGGGAARAALESHDSDVKAPGPDRRPAAAAVRALSSMRPPYRRRPAGSRPSARARHRGPSS